MNDFEEFKRVYPKREGSQKWYMAEKKFAALVKSGVDPKAIILGAKLYAYQERKNVGSPYIAMASTWLNQQRFCDSPAVEERLSIDWEAILVTYKKFGLWSRYAGPDPESPACRCPAEILAKHNVRAAAPPPQQEVAG